MMVSARLGAGIGVDQGRGQPRQGVEQVVLGADRDLVRLDRADPGVNDDFALGAQLMSDPPQADLACIKDAGGGAEGPLGLVDQGRVDRIHQAPVDLAGRPAQRRPGSPR